MSEFKSVWGFGGVKFTLGQKTVTFDFLHNKGEIEFEPELFEKRTFNKKNLVRLIGWDAVITVKLSNYKPDDYLSFFSLFDIINESYRTNTPFTIQPRFAAGVYYTLAITCYFKGKIKPEDIERYECGQELELKFYSVYQIPELPKVVNTFIPSYLLLESGGYLLLESGGKILKD